jgi:hypothetical protein
MPSILICSVSPETYTFKRSYNWNGLVIPACPKDKPFSSLLVTDQMDDKVVATDHWAEHSIHTPFPVSAQTVVTDLFSTSDLIGRKGCFIPKGELPTEEEVTNARLTRRAYLMELVQRGDSEWTRTHRVDDIPGDCKRAVVEMGIEGKEWMSLAPPAKPPMFDCPVCGEDLKVGVAMCKSCGAILDKEKAAKYSYSSEPVAKEKPPKVI